MPELPEVETIKRQLGTALTGQKISEVEVLRFKNFEGDKDALIGMTVVGVRRFGKALVIDLAKNDDADVPNGQSLVIHLKMTGQLIYEPHGVGTEQHRSHRLGGGHPTGDFLGDLPSIHTRVIVKFVQGGVLFFNDQRMFGWVKQVATDVVEKMSFVSKLGPEPWMISDADWVEILRGTRKPVKVRIMDQDKVAGVGNIYANDALWVAKIDPRRPAKDLTSDEALCLKKAVMDVLDEGILYGGATAFDGKFVDLKGLGGKYQEHFKVYQRTGEKCLRCDGVIVKTMLGGRGTFWCEQCQK